LVVSRSFSRKELGINVVDAPSVKEMSLAVENSVARSTARLELVGDTGTVVVRLVAAVEEWSWPSIVPKFDVEDEDKPENVA